MDFEIMCLLYLVCFGLIYCNFTTTHYISERFDKGIIVKNNLLKKILWIYKELDYISYVSIVFIIINYIFLIATITCFIICLCVSKLATTLITWVLFLVLLILFVVEHAFTPPYGVRGS